MVGIVITRARHSAKIGAKSPIISKKKLFQSSRTYAVKWLFLAEKPVQILPPGLIDRFDTQVLRFTDIVKQILIT
jgi:hypothetical protein